jgi:hypothetical protein
MLPPGFAVLQPAVTLLYTTYFLFLSIAFPALKPPEFSPVLKNTGNTCAPIDRLFSAE